MKDVIDILKKAEVIVSNSHFVGTSGRHMPTYINKDLLISNTKYASYIGKLFAEKFKNMRIEVVVAPAVAAIALSQWTAFYLSKIYKKEVLALYTEKTADNNQIFKRGYDKMVKGRRVLLVEDVVTTGSSIKKVVRTVKRAGGRVIAASAIINRSPNNVDSVKLGFPFSALCKYKIESYESSRCPLCKKGIPIDISLGHGNKYLNKSNHG